MVFYCLYSFLKAYSGFLSTVTKTKYKFRKLLEFSGEFIYNDDRQDTPYNRICSENISESLKNLIVTLTIMILSFIIAYLGPLLSYVQDGTIVTFYELRLPYLYQYPNVEYIINTIWQSSINILAVFSFFLAELMQTLINDSISVTSKLSRLELDQLSNQLEEKDRNEATIGRKLTSIFMKMAYMDE